MAALDLVEPLIDARAQLTAAGFRQGRGSFQGAWSTRNPWNIPGAIYVSDDDACGTGPDAAPNNVWLPSKDECVRNSGGEFVFRQASSSFELRQIVLASETNVTDAYGLDGDDHWTADMVRQWWSEMKAIENEVRARADAFLISRWPSAGLRRWLDYMGNGAETYLRRYIAYLEGGLSAAAEADPARLPPV